ncbi:MAG TPA: NAD(P)H-dependent oxidoreductase [Anaeromyxobacteraceae bacterium]|nr:NAD(P)H-dependent oxidoreductase [Anaeromyxobacteraceae bacterium]
MRLTMLDGTQEPGPMDAWLRAVAAGLAARGHQVRRLALRELRLCQCRGCFGCWVKTPGRCVIRDDGERLLRELVAADVAVFASPVSMGFTSALLRRATERLLPLLHPFFRLVDGEVHHVQRYPRVARVALLHGHEGVDEEDRALLRLLHERMALNLDARLVLVAASDRRPEEVCDALARA